MRSSCCTGRTKEVSVLRLFKRGLLTNIFFFFPIESYSDITLSALVWNIELLVTSSSSMFASAEKPLPWRNDRLCHRETKHLCFLQESSAELHIAFILNMYFFYFNPLPPFLLSRPCSVNSKRAVTILPFPQCYVAGCSRMGTRGSVF